METTKLSKKLADLAKFAAEVKRRPIAGGGCHCYQVKTKDGKWIGGHRPDCAYSDA